jgi:hypothetical protein
LRFSTNRRKLAVVIDPDDDFLEHGARVEVRQRFDGKWSKGFVVESANDEGYTVRRELDGVVLPERFPPDDVRHEKRHLLFWRH